MEGDCGRGGGSELVVAADFMAPPVAVALIACPSQYTSMYTIP